MFVPDDKMKVNAFRIVAIPRPIEFMRRFGSASAPTSSFTGDDVAPLPQNKVDILAYADQYDRMMLKVESEKEKSDGV